MSGLAPFAVAIAIGVLAWRVRALSRRLIDLGAVSPWSAVPVASLSVRRGPMFRLLVRTGVIATAGPDRHYFNQDRYQAWGHTRRKRALILLAAAAALATVAWVAGWL